MILTHFSPRYQKVAEITAKMLEPNSTSFIAFDHTRISWSQLEWAPQILPLYNELLSNEEEKKAAPEKEAKPMPTQGAKKNKPQKQKKGKG